MRASLILLLSPAVVVGVPFDASSAHFPYAPFGLVKDVKMASNHKADHSYDNHFISLGKANNNKKVKMVRKKTDVSAPASEEEHYPYAPIGVKPYEHHWIQPKAKKDVRMVSTNSITNLPNPDDFQEAQEAIFEAVEKAERGLIRLAKRCEQAAEHAIEDEVNVMFCLQGQDQDNRCKGDGKQ